MLVGGCFIGKMNSYRGLSVARLDGGALVVSPEVDMASVKAIPFVDGLAAEGLWCRMGWNAVGPKRLLVVC